MKLYLRKKFIEIPAPAVMGVLNITPDSFSDGGLFLSIDDALKQVKSMIVEGADIIDVGGESTRPGAEKVSIDEEIDRIIPVVERIKKEFEVLVSIDTYKERVARMAVTEAEADMVNDISGLGFSENMASTISSLDVPVVVMHIQGTPENMQKNPCYQDVMAEIKEFFTERINFALSKGIKKEKIIIDPGIGFGKRFEDNIEIIKRLSDFKEFDCPVLIGLSRKTFLGEISGEKTPRDREAETITANIISILNGASIIRVHNVRNAVRSIGILKNLVDLE
jgi:dihydropteroate synthase